MSDDTLLDIAKRNLETANLVYEVKQDDEAFLNIVGYHLQQTIEIGIKHYLENHAIKYPFTHDIAELISLVPEEEISKFEKIEDMAGTITQLEAKTRYVKNYRVTKRIVDKLLPIANTLIEDISQQDKKEAKQSISQDKENIKIFSSSDAR